MQGLADGYFVVPFTLGSHIAGRKLEKVTAEDAPFRDAVEGVRAMTERLLSIQGSRSVDSFHRELGFTMWDKCGMARTAEGLTEARETIRRLRDEFWRDVRVTGKGAELNKTLEHAGRVADFLEFAELMVIDALHRDESCGGHFREEHQTAEGEAQRDDQHFAYVAAWEFAGVGEEPVLHKEPLEFHEVKPTQRSYK
jgi:succinate dehydrogenase / fumarate reductase flavoprotein subunit